jgi:hypothetical protein
LEAAEEINLTSQINVHGGLLALMLLAGFQQNHER